ncbi:MAG: ACP S-malonyltransferase [Spirochaetales bacterium]|nr:ACP S-malonyltransferase [Spirochaetales bacterium]
MNEPVFLFDGQGSFFPGIGKSLIENYHAAREIINTFNTVLQDNIEEYCYGKKAIMTKKNNMWIQLTITAINLAYAQVLAAIGIFPRVCSGHSLGEISALIFSGIVSIEDGIRIVKKRGELMDYYSKELSGDMMAVIGLNLEKVEKIISELKIQNNMTLEIANINSPDQIIVSGLIDELYSLRKYILDNEKKVSLTMLNVGGPWHNPQLMEKASEEFAVFLDTIPFHIPEKKFFSVTLLDDENDIDHIKKSLSLQLVSRVNWNRAVEILINKNYNSFIEIGAGKILKNLLRKISSNVSCETATSIIDKS